MAQVASWAGEPRVALAAWSWLAAHGSADAGEKAIELAQALFDHQAVVALIEARARQRQLKLPELLYLTDALESAGDPDSARATLRRFEPLFADQPEYWHERAALDEHVGDLDGALFSIRQVTRRFAGSVEVGVEPELLWSLDRPADALAVARIEAQSAPASASQFWKLYGDLAWSMEADATRRTRMSTSGPRRRRTPRSPNAWRRFTARNGAPTIWWASRATRSRSWVPAPCC